MTGKSLIRFVLAFLTALSAGPAIAGTVSYNGKIISTSVRVIDGVAYMPVADAAKAIGGAVTQSGSAYTIQAASTTAAGGANQINGLTGDIGQTLFTGEWRFKALSVTIVRQFQTQYAPDARTDNPASANDELVIVNGIVKNAQTSTAPIALLNTLPMDTTITDDSGQSYGAPIDFDRIGDRYGPVSLVPGAAVKFNAVFDCPTGTKLQSLIFSLARYDKYDEMHKPTDVRIDITSANQTAPQ